MGVSICGDVLPLAGLSVALIVFVCFVDWDTQSSEKEEGQLDYGCTTTEKGTSTAEIVVTL